MKIFAHRGASKLAPENTLAAIQLALQLPIDGVEIDVYPLGDDYIVLHDRWLTRTTGIAKRLDQVTLNEVRELSAGSYQGRSQSVPLLSEVLALNWEKKRLNIELKHLDDTQHFLAYLEKHLAAAKSLTADNIIISAFNHHYLAAINRSTPCYKLGWLTASNYLDYASQAAQQGCYSINIDIDVINEEIVKNAHQLGIKVFVYTADEPDDINFLVTLGVDGVFTNKPDIVSQLFQTGTKRN